MPLCTLKNAKLNTAFSKDTTIAVKDFLTTDCLAGEAGSDTSFVAANINFDIKLSRMDKLCHVIIELMSISIRPLGTGAVCWLRAKNMKFYKILTLLPDSLVESLPEKILFKRRQKPKIEPYACPFVSVFVRGAWVLGAGDFKGRNKHQRL